MKSKLLIPILFVFLFALSVAAPPTLPYAISGSTSLTDESCLSGFYVEITAMNIYTQSDATVKVEVNNNCEYLRDLGYDPFPLWWEGMNIDIKFCDTDKNPNCLKTIAIGEGGCESGGGCVVDYVFQPGDIIETPDGPRPADQVIREYQCWDGSIVKNLDDCPPEEPEEGTEAWYYWIIGSLISVAAGLLEKQYGWGRGFIALVRYYVKTGDYKRAVKMMHTAIKKAKAGKYK